MRDAGGVPDRGWDLRLLRSRCGCRLLGERWKSRLKGTGHDSSVRHPMIFRSALCWFLLFGSVTAGAEIAPRYSGLPLMRVFTERETGGAARNHAIAVHPSGLVYAANDVGLREFDGVTWRVVPGTERRMVFNVIGGPEGKIYYGGAQHFGVLRVTADGSWQAEALHAKLPENDRSVGDVRGIVAVGADVYFHLPARGLAVRVDSAGGVHPIRLPEAVYNFLVWEGVLYVASNEAVFRVEGDRVTAEPAPPLGLLAIRTKIHGAWAHPAGGAYIVTRNGLRRWQGETAPAVSDAVARALGADAVVVGCPLGDGTFALGTRTHGVLIVAEDGRVLTRYDQDNGLGAGASYVEGLAVDGDGGLWVAHDGGVTRIEVRNPGALHGVAVGLRGRQIFALALHRGRLHVGTSQGIFVRDPETGRFAPLPGVAGNIGALVSTEEGLIVAAERLQLVRDGGAIDVIDGGAGGFGALLRVPREPDVLVASSSGGLRVYRRTAGHWQLLGAVPGSRERCTQLQQDAAGWVWAVRDPWQVVRVDWRQGVRLGAPVEFVGAAQGLPSYADKQTVLQLLTIDGAIAVASERSLRRHDPAQDRFSVETQVAGLAQTDVAHTIFSPGEDLLWLVRPGAPSRLGVARRSAAGAWAATWEPSSGFEPVAPRVVLHDVANRTVWLGGQHLASYDLARPRFERALSTARVRRVTGDDGIELWNGAGPVPAPVLASERNGLTFAYAAAEAARTNVLGQILVGYRTQLEGFDRDWSSWSLATARTYTNLPPGAYTFRVQSGRDDYVHGREAAFSFQVQAPWWRTWWFVGVAGVSGVGSVAGVTRWLANRALRRRLQMLEARSAVERERLRLARDLHDEVGSGLGRVILFAGEARRHKADAAQLELALNRVRDTAQELVQHAREIVWAVSPQHDTLASVVERLGDYAEETLRAAGIACRVEAPRGAELLAAKLGSEARHSLFLAVKEAVHNCVKYSGAKTAEFRLHVAEQHLVVTLCDQGRGFVSGEQRGTGHGLVNLAARAKALGGDAVVTSEVGRGTTVTLRVPLEQNTTAVP